ncbi:recombinase family protein [Candidatus Woesebacteria bacterium]|nr:recombinase family protein [Candidatus Woesebacteria bacterium]MCD8526848.1 recombinase family protein [Candidatus Woesebacteria bacterium]MCD8545812.1 recombinase family protein [Candidatus Woesebacteria bacterium]
MYQSTDTSQFDHVKNCLLYARVSTSRQVEEGHSLEDQIERLTKFAKDREWRILEAFKDGGKSGGSTSGRAEFNRMLERCADDPDVHAVLLEETDRFARNAQDHLAVKSFLKKHDVVLIATQQPNFGDDPVGNFVDLIMAGANQLQREITGVKTKRTMVGLAEKGLQPGGAVLGYLNSYEKGVPWKIDKEREYYVKEAFRRYNTDNYSIHTLGDELYAEGFRTRNGKRVHSSNIQKILTDVRYLGWVKYDGKIYKNGQHPQLINITEFKKAEAIMKKHNKGANRSRKHNWFLAGLVYCQHCGSLMSGEKHEKSTGKIYKYYRCMGPKNHGHTCDEPYANIEKVHDQLYKWITGLEFTDTFFDGLRQELMSLMENQGDTVKDRLDTLQKRKESIEKKMDKLEDQMVSEVIPQDRIEKKYKPLRDELTAVEAKIEKLNRPSNNMDEEKIETIIKFMKRLPELYDAFNKKERKQFLKWFTTKIMIKDKKIVDITYTPGFQAMVDRDIVRISETWLPRVDSNHEP